jgi:hypothetical protein
MGIERGGWWLDKDIVLGVDKVSKRGKVGADGVKGILDNIVDWGFGKATREEMVTVLINLVGAVATERGGWGAE